MSGRAVLRDIIPPVLLRPLRSWRRARAAPDFSGVYTTFEGVQAAGGAGFASAEGVRWALEKASRQREASGWMSTSALGPGDQQFVATVNMLAHEHGAVEVIDVGGGVGNAYLAARPYLGPGVSWVVVELPALVAAGREFHRADPAIRFTQEMPENSGPAARVALFRSALQYLPDAERAIAGLARTGVRHVALVPLTAGDVPGFWTKQLFRGAHHPLRIFNTTELTRTMAAHGYALVSRCGDTEFLDMAALPAERRISQTLTLIFSATSAGRGDIT